MAKLIFILCAAVAAVSCVDVEKYLQKFGYYNPNSFDQSNLKDSIKTFQRTFNLPVTGVVDDATKKLMNTPRCGLPDHGTSRNAFADTRWNKKSLTYYFSNYSPDLSESQLRQITATAFRYWVEFAPLTFTETSRRGDIVLAFGSRGHRDNRKTCGFPFDGRSGTLAHAFFPPDGRLHFDEDEYWTDRTSSGQNYLSTAVHEIGHILGLEHDSSSRDSIMYPYAQPYKADLRLHANDIRRIQRLYGRGKGSVITRGTGGGGPATRPPVTNPPFGCKDKVTDCYKWTNRCRNYSDAWTNYMRTYCARQCRYC